MTPAGLSSNELALIQGVFKRFPGITQAKLFGSRAKGTHLPGSDVDLALWGQVDGLSAESIRSELDDLPLPYHYDVLSYQDIKLETLREHIERVGVVVYP
jgi:predicted nucleotidyltransferase